MGEALPAGQVADPASVAFASFADSLSALVARLGAEETMRAINAELERVQSFVEAATPIPAVVTPGTGGKTSNGPGPTGASDAPASTAGGGGLTHEQLQALARCESGLDPYAGDPSPWRTGYFGLEAGHPVGGLSLAEQEAEVQRIYAQYGARAWGCPI